jgi:oligopeptide/dipeptide ABC transporter ATP-binding protein
MLFTPILSIVAGLIAQNYKPKDERKRFKISIGLIIATLLIVSFFNFTFMAFLGFIILLLTMLILVFLPNFVVSFFVISWGDRSQLLKNKRYLYLSASILATLIMLSLPASVTSIILGVVLSGVLSFILKYIFVRRIPLGEIRELSTLEKGKDLLQINNLKVYYPLIGGVLKRQIGAVRAVDGVTLKVKTGETLGLVGESGCGKSTLAKAILGLVEIEQGEIFFRDIAIDEDYSSYLRQKIQIVFQDPDASLNPRLKVVDIISEPLKNILGITKKTELRKHVLKLLEEVSLKREHLDRYPHEFSGGQKQRIVIARALACNPELIILDEPTSALDVSVQAQILNLLKNLQQTYGYGFLFITHNLAVVNHIADNVAVMYLGRIVEIGTKKQIFARPTHPYTQALLKSRIRVDPDSQDIKFVIDGEVPSPIAPPPGCHFNPRCVSDARTKECTFETPHMIEVEENHYIWCVNEPKDLKY